MTLVDRLIVMEFWFEYGISKLSIFMGLATLGLSLTTLLTVKGIFFPLWGFLPIAVLMYFSAMTLGYFLDTRNVMGRFNSHMNRKGNPEFVKMIEDVDEIKRLLEGMKANE